MLTTDTLENNLKSKRKGVVYDLGSLTDYKWVWDFQRVLVEKRLNSQIQDSLVLNEHNHVLTIGRNGHRENLLQEGLPLYEIERGGDITYHGPGQLVGYPIVDLQQYPLGIKQYVQLLEQVLVEALDQFDIKSEGRLGKETGVWTLSGRKIASIGVAVSHWISYHGFALNVSTDLSYFHRIKPCGFDSEVMTSIENELGKSISMREVKDMILSSFSERFALDLTQEEF